MTRSRNALSATAIIISVLMILPLVPLAVWSVTSSWYFPNLLPQNLSSKAWQFVASDRSGVLASLWTTMQIAVLVAMISTLLGVPAGKALGLTQFRGKTLVEFALLAPLIVPSIATTLGIHGIFIWLGLTNTIMGVVLVHLVPALPYMIFVMSGVFANHDTAFEDQARSLGATPMRTFWLITLPVIMPGIAVGALFTFLVSWSQYVLTLVIGGGRVITLPLLLFNSAQAGRNDLTGALSLIYILPGVLILIVTARYLTGRSTALASIVHP